MKARSYDILSRAIEEGVARGIRRAFKHTDSPSREFIMECVEHTVMNDICEVFSFDDDLADGVGWPKDGGSGKEDEE